MDMLLSNKNTVRRLVPVIVAFDRTGTMKPIRIQIDDEVYTVTMCFHMGTCGPIVRYSCDVKHGNNFGTVSLTYNIDEKRWYVEL